MTSSNRAFVGQLAPAFTMASTRNLDTLEDNVSLADYKGRFLVMVFYPLDFTFVCPTELLGFSDAAKDFDAEGASVLGISTDSVHSHRAWIKTARNQGGLGGLNFPLASDITHQVSRDYGVLVEDKGISLRGTFIIDPEGVLRVATIHDLDVGRSVSETLRALQAIKTGELCPADWRPGQKTL